MHRPQAEDSDVAVFDTPDASPSPIPRRRPAESLRDDDDGDGSNGSGGEVDDVESVELQRERRRYQEVDAQVRSMSASMSGPTAPPSRESTPSVVRFVEDRQRPITTSGAEAHSHHRGDHGGGDRSDLLHAEVFRLQERVRTLELQNSILRLTHSRSVMGPAKARAAATLALSNERRRMLSRFAQWMRQVSTRAAIKRRARPPMGVMSPTVTSAMELPQRLDEPAADASTVQPSVERKLLPSPSDEETQQLRKQVARLNLIVHDQRQVIVALGAAQQPPSTPPPPHRVSVRNETELFHSPSRVPSSDVFGDDVDGLGADEAVLDLPARDMTPPPSDATLAAQSEVARFQVLLRDNLLGSETERRHGLEEAMAERARDITDAGAALHVRARFEAGVVSLIELDGAARSRLDLAETEDRTHMLKRAGADRRLIEAQLAARSPQRAEQGGSRGSPAAQPEREPLESKSWSPKDRGAAAGRPPPPERASSGSPRHRRQVYDELLGEVVRVEGRTRARLVSHFLDDYEAIVADLEAAMFEADSAAYRQVSSGGFSTTEPFPFGGPEEAAATSAPRDATMADDDGGAAASNRMADDLGMLAAAAPVAPSDGGLEGIVLPTEIDHRDAAREQQFGSFVSSVGHGADSVAGGPRNL